MDTLDNLNDSTLWGRVCCSDSRAFEELVKRHQSAVCSVAYNACGNVAASEDISQETFLTAWRDRMALRDVNRPRAWFCGIARNLARNSVRRTSKLPESLAAHCEPASPDPEPPDAAVTQEEESLLWQALGEIDATYREPLILFYREDLSVADVASALDITPDAAKQRLSRGRAQLRAQVAVMVENALKRTRPAKAFTLAVMAGLSGMATGAKAAATSATVGALAVGTVNAGVAAVSKTAAGAASGVLSAATLGSLAGTAGGLLGGWLGTWLPAQLAPTKTQREFQLKVGRRILIVSIILCLFLLVVMRAIATDTSGLQLVFTILGWIALLKTYLLVEIWLQFRGIAKIQATIKPESDPNDSKIGQLMQSHVLNAYEGRVYRSRTWLLGIPLIDINVCGEWEQNIGQLIRRRACGGNCRCAYRQTGDEQAKSPHAGDELRAGRAKDDTPIARANTIPLRGFAPALLTLAATSLTERLSPSRAPDGGRKCIELRSGLDGESYIHPTNITQYHPLTRLFS